LAFSNTYSFAPGLSEIGLQAFQIAGVRPTALTQEHLVSLRMAANLLLASWSNLPNLWSVTPTPTTITLVAGTPTYSIPSNIVLILDAYVEITNGADQPIDRIVLPVSRSEYSAYPNKLAQGQVTTFWHNRQITDPSVSLYFCPDGVSATTFKYYGLIQLQDVTTTGGQQPFVPYVFQEAFCYGLALRLAEIWTPERVAMIAPRAKETYDLAASTNVEQASVYISPVLESYYRV
jgi:hypothetical protein